MRWPANKTPAKGDRREVERFAWLPVCAGDRWLWLERYVSEEDLGTRIVYDGILWDWVRVGARPL